MSEHAVTDSEGIENLFRQFVDRYGQDALKEPRRIIGFILDANPKMFEYAKYISKAYQLNIPNKIESGQIADNNFAMDAVKCLAEKDETEVPLLIIEGFCKMYGKQVSLKPDYSNGAKIPYKSKKGDGLIAAVEQLDHIRWLLNHYTHYKWKNGSNILKPLWVMMNSPENNKDAIRKMYKEIVHGFQNNPYEVNIIIDDEVHTNGFTSNVFSDYFVLIGDEPVSMEFAKYHGGSEVDQSIKSWQAKEKSFKEKVGKYYNKIANSTIPDISIARYKAYETGSYILWSIVILGVIGFLFKSILQTFGLIDNYYTAKQYKQNVIELLWQYHNYQNLKYYSILLIVIVISLIPSLVVVVTLFISILRWKKAKKFVNASQLLNNDLWIFDNKILKSISEINDIITNYYKGVTNKTHLNQQDYSVFIKSISGNRYGTENDINKLKSVPRLGKKCQKLIVICAIFMFILSKSQIYSRAQIGSQEFNVLITKISRFEDNHISPIALEYDGHYYYVYDDASSWNDAKEKCEDMGGNLVKITTQEEDTIVYNYMKQMDYDTAFLGLKMIKEKKDKEQWYWITGKVKKKIKYANWTEEKRDKDCIYGVYGADDESKWRAVSESYVTTYICEWNNLESGKKNK